MKKGIFSENITVCDLKLMELMKNVCIQGQGHLFTLAKGHLHMKIKLAFLSNHLAIFSQILNIRCTRKLKFINIMLVTWPRWPTCPYMVKKLKIFFPGTTRLSLIKLVWSIRDLSPLYFVQIMTLGWPWPILWQVIICNLGFYMAKCDNDGFFGNYCILWPGIG